PDQRMTNRGRAAFPRDLDAAVSLLEGKPALLRLCKVRLHAISTGNGAEVPRSDCHVHRSLTEQRRIVQRRADQELAPEGVFKGRYIPGLVSALPTACGEREYHQSSGCK